MVACRTYRSRVALEVVGQIADVDEVGGEGCVVVGEVPLPGGAALVVVAQHPAQAQHVLVRLTQTQHRPSTYSFA